MGSYQRVPTTEDTLNNIDAWKLTPQSRSCFILPPWFGCGLLFIVELLIYLFCKSETLINTVICITSITFGTLIYSFSEYLANFCNDNLQLTFIYGVKFALSIILIYCYNLVPYLYEFPINVMLFYSLSFVIFIYLKFFKTCSWNAICYYSNKKPPLGEALAHQTYEGFYSKILPKICKEIRKLPKEDIPVDLHFIILLPKSGLQMDKLIENDTTNNLQITNGLLVIREDNGGTINREYKIRKYKIQRQNEKSQFCCFFEVPSSLGNMKKLAKQINDSPDYMWEQYQIYLYTLKYCIENDERCVGNYKIIAYNDVEKEGGISLPLSSILEKITDGKQQELNLIL